MITDKNNNAINVGDVLFYSERPHSNYADSLVAVYESNGKLKVETIVVNVGGYYQLHFRDATNDLELDAYGRDVYGKQGDSSKELTLIPGLSRENATVEYALLNYPLTN